MPVDTLASTHVHIAHASGKPGEALSRIITDCPQTIAPFIARNAHATPDESVFVNEDDLLPLSDAYIIWLLERRTLIAEGDIVWLRQMDEALCRIIMNWPQTFAPFVTNNAHATPEECSTRQSSLDKLWPV